MPQHMLWRQAQGAYTAMEQPGGACIYSANRCYKGSNAGRGRYHLWASMLFAMTWFCCCSKLACNRCKSTTCSWASCYFLLGLSTGLERHTVEGHVQGYSHREHKVCAIDGHQPGFVWVVGACAIPEVCQHRDDCGGCMHTVHDCRDADPVLACVIRGQFIKLPSGKCRGMAGLAIRAPGTACCSPQNIAARYSCTTPQGWSLFSCIS